MPVRRTILPLLLLLSTIVGCPTEEPELPPIGWDPAVTDSGSGELDLGVVEFGSPGQNVAGTITATNNTEEDVPFEAPSCNFDNGGFLLSCPAGFDLAPGADMSVGVTFAPPGPGEYDGTITFIYGDDQVTTYIVRAEATQ